jgi:hypothetical protein
MVGGAFKVNVLAALAGGVETVVVRRADQRLVVQRVGPDQVAGQRSAVRRVGHSQARQRVAHRGGVAAARRRGGRR